MILRKSTLLMFAVLVVLVSACQQSTPVPTPDLFVDIQQPADTPKIGFDGAIEWVECPFDTDEMKPRCGYLTVPLDYAQPNNGETLRLGFAVYQSGNTSPQPDPVIYISAAAYTSRSRFFAFRFEQTLQERDVLAFDLRGTGLSEPLLNCPEIGTLVQNASSTGGLSPDQWQSVQEQCRQTLEGQALNLEAYSMANLAADIKALRLALGYVQWNLIAGESLGATLAYEQLTLDPEGVRSLVFDGTLPLMTGAGQDYADVQRVLSEFFGLCTQDDQCQKAFPDLESVFYQAVRQLNSQPVQVAVKNMSTGTSTDLSVDGDRLISLVLSVVTSGQEENLGLIPRMIYQLQEGNGETLAQIAGNTFSDSANTFSDAFSTLLRCRQAPPNEAQINAGLSKLPPELAQYFEKSAQVNLAVCKAWQPLPNVSPSTASGLTPILLFSGSWNWSGTPANGVARFQQNAPETQVVTLPMRGRFSLFSRNAVDCTQGILNAFITNPNAQVDTQCIPSGPTITWITLQ